MKTKRMGTILRISIIMILATSIALVNPVLAECATVTVDEVPPETLGTIGLNEPLNLEFGASISKAYGSIEEFVVNFSRAGFTYEGFTATLNGSDISSSFMVEVIDAKDTTVHVYSLPPDSTPNGVYSMTFKFKTKNIEGNYAFDWQLWLVGLSYPPDLPTIIDDVTGKATVEIESPPPATIEETLEKTNDYIQKLEADAFKNNNKASKKKKVFDDMFNALDNKLADEDYKGMINYLLHNVRSKVDGHVDGSLKNDWITDPDIQEELCQQIDDMIDYLASLL